MLYLPTFSCVSYGFHAGKHASPMDPVGTAEPVRIGRFSSVVWCKMATSHVAELRPMLD